MSNLDVALRLRLVNGLSGPANQAERDLRDIERAARGLNGARGGDRLARDINRLGQEARKTDRDLQSLARRSRSLPGAAVGGGARRRIVPGTVGAAAEEAGSALGVPPLAMNMGRIGVAGGAIAGAIIGTGLAIRGATREAIKFEDAMAEVRKAVDLDPVALKSMEQAILRISRVTPLAKEEIAKLVAQAGFAGRPTEDLVRFGTFAAKAAVAFGMSAEETGDSLAKLGNVFGLTQQGIEALSDAVNVLGDSTAAKESDIIEFLKRVGSQARAFGLAERETAAFGAALLSVGVSTEVAATGFGSFVTRLSTATKQGKSFQAALRQLGLSSKQVAQMIKDGPAAAIVEVLKRIKELAPEKQAGVLVDMFGLEYADDAARMAGSIDLMVKSLQQVIDQGKNAGSVEKAFKIFDELTSSKLEKAGNQLAAFGVNVGTHFTPAIGGAADALSNFLEKINETYSRAAEIEEIADKVARGEEPTPEQKDKLAKDPELAQEVKQASGRKDHPLIGAVERKAEIERDIAADEPAAGRGDISAKMRLLNLRAQLNQINAEIEAALKLPGAAEAAAQSMQNVAKAIGAEGEQAVAKSKEIADRIRETFNFTVSPTISPQFIGPRPAGVPADGKVPTPPPRPKKTSSAGSTRTVAQTNTINIHGGEANRTARALERRLARLGNNAGALFDTA